jgi:hypothetical protein
MTIPFAISIRSAAVTYFRGVPGKHAVLKITFMKRNCPGWLDRSRQAEGFCQARWVLGQAVNDVPALLLGGREEGVRLNKRQKSCIGFRVNPPPARLLAGF